MSGDAHPLLGHSGHDYGMLLSRWEQLAADRNWNLEVLYQAGDLPVLVIETSSEADGIYVSAGVHGDECAPPWALLQWAESTEVFFSRPAVLFPCLNPQGFLLNTREDQDGVDLNRNFQNPDVPLVGAWQKYLEGRSFDVAINLHEDYDATGIYLYELARRESVGGQYLSACEELIGRESGEMIDGSEFENGLLQRDVDEEELRRVVEEDLDGGFPEAIWLYLSHARDSFTFETPSEMELGKRIATHRRFLEAATR